MSPASLRLPVALFGLSLLGACAAGAHKRVDGREFARLCATTQPQSTRATTWIGRTGDRAYIEVWYGGAWWLGGGIDVCSTLLADLAPEVREAILRGADPTTLPTEVLVPPPPPKPARKPDEDDADGDADQASAST
jgi:hypothetical protein